MAMVEDLLWKKGKRVLTIAPTATVLEATQTMNGHKVGALVVTTGGEEPVRGCDRVVGMFTERDVLTRVVGEQRDPARTLVEEVMTTDVAYCRRDTPIEQIAAVMRERRIRHIPVCDDDGNLRGLVSIGDLNAWHAEGQQVELEYLHEYIHGRV